MALSTGNEDLDLFGGLAEQSTGMIRKVVSRFNSIVLIVAAISVQISDIVLGALALGMYFTYDFDMGFFILPKEVVAWVLSISASGIQTVIWDKVFNTIQVLSKIHKEELLIAVSIMVVLIVFGLGFIVLDTYIDLSILSWQQDRIHPLYFDSWINETTFGNKAFAAFVGILLGGNEPITLFLLSAGKAIIWRKAKNDY